MDTLRVAAIGSVDDGKSTLIGRLLYDSTSIFEDQLHKMAATGTRRGRTDLDLSLATDALRAEVEQGITIDVAYRYFATPNRRFVLADCPGHEEYTRNMVTGSSTADVAVVLIDARHGVVAQTRRHSLLVDLMALDHLIVCVNKMDLVGYRHDVFDTIRAEFEAFFADRPTATSFIPISALKGDNVVQPSTAMPWYQGPSLIEALEQHRCVPAGTHADGRFPVQYVIRTGPADGGEPRYAGTVAHGTFTVGEQVTVHPSGHTTTIARIDGCDGPVTEARAGDAVTITVSTVSTVGDHLDIGRGDMICPTTNATHPPTVTTSIEARMCWLDDTSSLAVGATYALQHTTRHTRARVTAIHHRVDITTMEPTPAAELSCNEIGLVSLECTSPLAVDPYDRIRATGSFILIDETTHQTVAGGMVTSETGPRP